MCLYRAVSHDGERQRTLPTHADCSKAPDKSAVFMMLLVSKCVSASSLSRGLGTSLADSSWHYDAIVLCVKRGETHGRAYESVSYCSNAAICASNYSHSQNRKVPRMSSIQYLC